MLQKLILIALVVVIWLTCFIASQHLILIGTMPVTWSNEVAVVLTIMMGTAIAMILMRKA